MVAVGDSSPGARFRVERVTWIAGLLTLDVLVQSGELRHAVDAVDSAEPGLRLRVHTVAFVRAANRSPQARTLTVELMSGDAELLVGRVFEQVA